MRVLVGVNLTSVFMLVGMAVFMFVSVYVPVFVIAFHGSRLLPD